MAATGGLPTRSRIDAFDKTVAELFSTAAHLRAGGKWLISSVEAYVTQVTAPNGAEWDGQAANRAFGVVHADALVMAPAADHADAMADVAERGGNGLLGARELALEAIAVAEADDFTVGQDLSVADNYEWADLRQRAARLAAARAHCDYIVHHAGLLEAENDRIGSQLGAGAVAMGGMVPAHWGQTTHDGEPVPLDFGPDDAVVDDGEQTQRGIRAVDNHHGPLPQDRPSNPGLPQPPGGWSDEWTMNDAQHIAYGHAWEEHWKNLPGMTQNKLADLVRDMLTASPKTDPGLFVGQTPGGSTVIYKDGTVVIYDPNSGDRGTVFKPDHGFDDFLKWTKPAGVAAEAPLINAPPSLPSVLDHPPAAPLPLQPGHAPVTLPPTEVVDPATLPPWLQNPSPPGFQLSPSRPPVFAWDHPDAVPAPAPTPSPAPPSAGPAISWPSPQDATKASAGVIAAIGGILGLLAHPGRQPAA